MYKTIFDNWVGQRCCVDRSVPEAICNPVAIKLLGSRLLT